MIEPTFFQTSEALEAVGVDCRTRGHVLLDETFQRRCLEVRDHSHPETTRAFAPFLYGYQDECRSASFELPAPAKSRLRTANPGVVYLHFAVELFARRIDHRSSELVKHHPGRFVASQSQLPLEKKSRDTTLIRGHQIRCPKPKRQRDSCVVKNSPGSQRDLVPTSCALPTSLLHNRISASMPASATGEAVRPATCCLVILAGGLAGELYQKLWQVLRKGWACHPDTLQRVTC